MKIETIDGGYAVSKDSCKSCFGRGWIMITYPNEDRKLAACACVKFFDANGKRVTGKVPVVRRAKAGEP